MTLKAHVLYRCIKRTVFCARDFFLKITLAHSRFFANADVVSISLEQIAM